MIPVNIHHIHLAEVDSTNTYLKRLLETKSDLPHLTLITTDRQVSGRGQQGNTWESEPGKNITLSLLIGEHLPSRSFDLCMITSLALYGVIRDIIPRDKTVSIKWPNDVYVDDHKIAGILIENQWEGSQIGASIIGIGFNINQVQFISDAPNPTSLAIECQHEIDREQVLTKLLEELQYYIDLMNQSPDQLMDAYHLSMYRHDGESYPFKTASGTLKARILGVNKQGILVLQSQESGKKYKFGNKEIAFILPHEA